ncbi:hypothetical protein ACFORH_34610 [Amycolatopsis roodepoortensis]|uniref:Secreted protein n=1 Tax=Amycolatopsis roodepoortensis TaxID=700274 RepID=A0ABR9L0V9_9PSEU|nr:hypothetical protein [Amycolatopsis roodepoortensis]MBE1574259.1 hypothetical protein [Amycolatopsis roodepoortensis]
MRELRFVGVTTAALLALGAGSASAATAADGGLEGQNEDSVAQDSERYRNFDLQEVGGPLLARVIVDLKDRDFTVCDKKANGYWAYASFQETVSSPPAKPYYRDTTSGPKCTHYNKTISKKKDIVTICQSDPLWDTCIDRGVRWW